MIFVWLFIIYFIAILFYWYKEVEYYNSKEKEEDKNND